MAARSVLPASGVDGPGEGTPRPPFGRGIIRSIRIHPPDPSAQTLLEGQGVSRGQPYSAIRLKEGIESLYRTGDYWDIRVRGVPSPGGWDLEVNLRYRQILSALDFDGNHVLKDPVLLDALRESDVAVGAELRDAALAKGLLRIQTRYQDAGYFRVRLRPTMHHEKDAHSVRLQLSISEREQTRIRSIRFTGEKVFSDFRLRLGMCPYLFLTCSMPGEVYSRKRLDRDIQRLLSFYENQGYLKAAVDPPKIDYRQRTNEVEISLKAHASDRIDIRMEGVAPLGRTLLWDDSEEQLRDLVLIREEKSDEEDVLEESARRMTDRYRKSGYPFAEVAFQRDSGSEGKDTVVTFRIAAGPRVRIRAVHFSGNASLSSGQLRQVLTIDEGDPYQKDRVGEQMALLRERYRKEGFLQAIVRMESDIRPERNVVELHFHIEEGVRTLVERIRFDGVAAFDEGTLLGRLVSAAGSPFLQENVKEDRKQLLETYHRAGYLRATVSPAVSFSEDQRGAHLVYTVGEGPLIRMGRLLLHGNLLTQEHIIRREMLLQTGDPLDFEKVRNSQRRLYRLTLFSEVRFQAIATSDPAVEDLLLTVQERPTGALEFGMGYADYEGLRGFIELSQRNLFGTGRTVSLRGEGSRVAQRYSLDFKEPWIFSRDMDGTVGVAFTRRTERTFELQTTSGSIGLSREFSDRLKGFLIYQFEENVIRDIDPVVSVGLTPEDIGRFNISSLNPSLIYDARDDLFNPTEGLLVRLSVRPAARVLGSEKQFVKGALDVSQLVPLHRRWIFAVSARAGLAKEFGESDEVPLSEHFFSGGRNTVRGYSQDKLGIPGQTLIEGRPIGGNARLIFNEEIRISLPYSIGLVFFFDHGNVWATGRQVRLDQIKSTTGAGIRYNTPVGPLRLDYGYKLNPEINEDRWALHFALGHPF